MGMSPGNLQRGMYALPYCPFSFFLESPSWLPEDQIVAARALTPVQVSQPQPSCVRAQQVDLTAYIRVGCVGSQFAHRKGKPACGGV